MTTWVKPNGAESELNDEPATIAKAESLGWKRKSRKKSKKQTERLTSEDVSD